jgi:hypothetical protein
MVAHVKLILDCPRTLRVLAAIKLWQRDFVFGRIAVPYKVNYPMH